MPQTDTSPSVPSFLVGRDVPLSEPVELRAGPVTALLYDGDLRHVRVGDVELVQRVYVAVRDAVWNTIPGTIEDLRVESAGETFEVTFACRHAYQDIDFAWRARIAGEADGSITYEMAGSPRTVFSYAKIGLNIHHPLSECVGRPFRAYRGGQELRGELPSDIEPQLFVDGTLTALFPEYDMLVIELDGGLEVRFDFKGDLFEMQDHRNWTDANLKSYGTPLSLPWPFDAVPGEEIRQSVRISFAGSPPVPRPRRDRVQIDVGEPTGALLPPIGWGMAEPVTRLSGREFEFLGAARPAHLRVDLLLGDDALEDRLDEAADQALALGAALELAVFDGGADPGEAARMLNVLEDKPVGVARVLVFAGEQGFSSTSGSTTPAALVSAVRAVLAPKMAGVAFAGGTNQFFTEINRNRPEAAGMDAVVYSINPQVHAADDLSVMENLQAQAATVAMARKLTGGLPVFVSPITLIGRYGPFPAGPPTEGGLSGNVDLRHPALFGAAWTVASVKELAQAGAAALTYYETTGPRGLIHSDVQFDGAAAFPFEPGDVFPVYHVFADLAANEPLPLGLARSSDSSSVDVLAVARAHGTELLIANLTQYEQAVVVKLPAPGEATARVLDASVAAVAMRDPRRFRTQEYEVMLGNGNEFSLDLAPYAVVRLAVRHP